MNLPDDGDYRNHSVESGIDPLNLGTYILITSDNPGFQRKKGLFSYQVFHVSNLAYWVKNEKSGSYVFVLNRKSGAPVENAKVALFEYRWNDRNRINERILFSETLTNREGFVKINQDNSYNSYEIAVSKSFDFLNLRNRIYILKSSEIHRKEPQLYFLLTGQSTDPAKPFIIRV